VIRHISSEPVDDLHEVRRRIGGAILGSKNNDHFNIEGFVYAEGNRRKLSPAFDINPLPSQYRVLEPGGIQGRSIDAWLEIAWAFFDVTLDSTEALIPNMARIIAESSDKRVAR